MAECGDYYVAEVKKFERCTAHVGRLVFADTPGFRDELSNLLDELNSIEYSLKIVKEEVAGWLLAKCCYLVPLNHETHVLKLCQLIVNLVSRQQLVLVKNLSTVIEYCLRALAECPPSVHDNVLRALGALLYENSSRVEKFYAPLIGTEGVLLHLITVQNEEIQRGALQCMENICARTSADQYLDAHLQSVCFNIFLQFLHTARPAHMDEVTHCRMLLSCLRGIQNLIIASKACPQEHLGALLAALKVYILHGMCSQAASVPASLYPTPASQYDPGPPEPPATPKQTEASSSASTTSSKTTPKSGKKGKKKRGAKKEAGAPSVDPVSGVSGVVGGMEQLSMTPIMTPDDVSHDMASWGSGLLPPWARISSSESEFSDTEGSQASKLRSYLCRVRQTTLSCFHAVIKVSEKRIMFGYWACFLPDSMGLGGPPSGQNLFTSIIKDPSPKARAGSLAVLTALMEGSKRYLMAAEDVNPVSTYTPFSQTLGHMVKEIHRCLLLGLVSENSPLVLTQIIKCLATLIPNVPYQRLKPGLLSRVVKQTRPFLAHRDSNIRVACLTCLGSVVSVQAPMMEVWQLLQAPTRIPSRHRTSSSSSTHNQYQDINPSGTSDSGFHSNHSLASPEGGLSLNDSLSSGLTTPTLGSGALTPTLAEQMHSMSHDTSWLVWLCVGNIAPRLLYDTSRDALAPLNHPDSTAMQPLPVRLESLQLMAQLAKGYFSVMSPCLPLICDLIKFCLQDKEFSVQLHGAKLLEEVGFMLLNTLQEGGVTPVPAVKLTVAEVVSFWTPLLNGPLPLVLQRLANHAVRSTACDCLADIGPLAFQELPLDKRMLCITLLLGLTGDEDHHVRAAAVRALGVYVLYPCLRQDVCFVADVANTVINALDETNLGVKVKAAWSLGNISDALVLNKDCDDTSFMDDFADMLLLKLFETAIAGSQDNDKVKSNAVRALGNFLRYLPQRSYGNSRFGAVIEQAIQALIKNVRSGAMKVRWNACYATANMFRNALLPLGTAPWTVQIHSALSAVVKDCKNFKVRINAAMAFSVPTLRASFGSQETFCLVWDSLLTGLQNSEAVADFSEYRYRDNLLEQVCVTLMHLGVVMERSDLTPLFTSIQHHLGNLQVYITRWCQICASKPDVLKHLPEVVDKLRTLSTLDLNTSEVAALTQFQHAFSAPPLPDMTKDPEQATHPASFMPTFD